MGVEAVILAGGAGTRMGAAVPKALLDFCGRPLLWHVGAAARPVSERVHAVHGPDIAAPLAGRAEALGLDALHLQAEPRGTADALACALPAIADDAVVLALCADTPLVTAPTLQAVLRELDAGAELSLLALPLPADSRLGRLLRDAQGAVVGIREYADASDAERAIAEGSGGVLAARAGRLRKWCAALKPDNAQGELYLTDCVAQAAAGGVVRAAVGGAEEGLGVNTPAEYAAACAAWQRRARGEAMDRGALFDAPETVWLSAATEIAATARIGPHAVFEGAVRVEAGAHVHAHAVLRDCAIGEGTEVHPFTVVERARVGARCRIGPFARLRPEAELEEEVRIGNFVEIKKSRIGARTRINHLAYVGDSEVGSDVNIGAGSYTCNYDGARKHATVIGDDVFIGSGVQMVAPVRVGDGATIGAGTTLTHDAPPGELTVGRARARTHPGWRRPRKP